MSKINTLSIIGMKDVRQVYINIKQHTVFDAYEPLITGEQKFYIVTKDLVGHINIGRSTDGLVNKLINQLLLEGAIKEYPVVEPNDKAHLHLIFRLGAILEDRDILYEHGTFTWLDDMDFIIKAVDAGQLSLPDPAKPAFIAIKSMFNWLNDATMIEARDHIEVDVLVTNIMDAAFNLYTGFVRFIQPTVLVLKKKSIRKYGAL